MIVELPALIESLERTVAELPSVDVANQALKDSGLSITLVADEIRKSFGAAAGGHPGMDTDGAR